MSAALIRQISLKASTTIPLCSLTPLRRTISDCAESGDKYRYIDVERHRAVTTIGINRPDKRNCINPDVASELCSALERFEQDPTAHVGVLHGCGGTFCSGFDLDYLSKMDPEAATALGRSPMGPTRKSCSKPLVAALTGYAVAGGLELALMCDLRVMDESAVLGVLNRRFGVPLVDGGTARLTAIIGLSRALDLVLTGRQVTSAEAFSWGLVDRLTPCGAALGQAVQLATYISQLPQLGLIADRRAVYYAAFEAKSLDDALRFERENSGSAVLAEAVRGAGKFVAGKGRHGKSVFDKWTPEWKDESI